jgi:hypothetical protein
MGVDGLVLSFSVLGHLWPASSMYVRNEMPAFHNSHYITLSLLLACPLSAKRVKCEGCIMFNSIK